MEFALSPEIEMLAGAAPLEMWDAARRQALRFPTGPVGVGACLFDARGGKLAVGCAHESSVRLHSCRTTHAELSALSSSRHLDLAGTTIVIVTIKQATGRWTRSSCPCATCARALHERGVAHAVFAERGPRGRFKIRRELVSDLVGWAPDAQPALRYARQQRVALPAIA